MVDIEKLRALLAAATPGPWKCMQDGTAAWIDQGNVKKAVWLGIARGDQNRRDANLIAAAVNALPELLDKVERLRAEVEIERRRAEQAEAWYVGQRAGNEVMGKDRDAARAEVERLRARTASLCDCALVARAGCPDCGGVGAVMVEGDK